MNQVTIIGRLGRDPEIRAANNGKVKANITVAVNRRVVTNEGEVKEFTDWINVVAWGNIAEDIGNSLTKGARVVVIGRYATRSYESNGSKRYITEVIASVVAKTLGDTKGDFSQFGTDQHASNIPF